MSVSVLICLRCGSHHVDIRGWRLLTKSARYAYNADAIAEPATGLARGTRSRQKGGRHYADGAVEHRTALNLHAISARETRNARSVWAITTRPYRGAHFATFPEALPERCIKAGSRVGDIVLDPFCGSGTTGVVAQRLGRDFLGIELNPAYVALAEQRIATAKGRAA